MQTKNMQCFGIEKMPKKNETISDYLDLDNLIPILDSIVCHAITQEGVTSKNKKEAFLIEFKFKDGTLYGIKFPDGMKKSQFMKFIEPLNIICKRSTH